MLGLAVSGGPDSLALLLLAHAALPGRIEAATVDHGLREASADEAAAVAAVCEGLGVPHRVLKVAVAPGNLQAEARSARYAALGRWMEDRGLEGLATAHHADDQAETLLMRLNRGSGLSGLTGIRALTSVPGAERRLLRPLLAWRRAELEGVAERAGLEPARDPSNDDDAFDRVRARKLLNENSWLDPLGFARSAGLLAEIDRALDRLATEEADAATELGEELVYFPYRRRLGGWTLRPLWIAVIQEMARTMGGTHGKAEIAAMVDRLERGEKCNVGGIQARVERRGGEAAWVLSPETPRRTG